MTSSATPTSKGPRAPLPPARAGKPAARSPFPRWPFLVAAILFGWIFVFQQNRQHVTTPVVILMIAWAALVGCGYWAARAALATVDDDERDWFRVGGKRDDLEREKRSLLKAIKEIEFDRETGKMSDADAAVLIAVYRSRAIETIKALDGLDGVGADGSPVLTPRDRILAELKARASLDGKVKNKGKKLKAKKAEEAAAPPAEEPAAPPAEEPATPAPAEPADEVKEDAS